METQDNDRVQQDPTKLKVSGAAYDVTRLLCAALIPAQEHYIHKVEEKAHKLAPWVQLAMNQSYDEALIMAANVVGNPGGCGPRVDSHEQAREDYAAILNLRRTFDQPATTPT